MAVSSVIVCDRHKIHYLRGLPDAPYTVPAVQSKDTHWVVCKYTEDPDKPATIDAAEAAGLCGCFVSDLMIVDWGESLQAVFCGAPWVHDKHDDSIVHVFDDGPELYFVNDFSDLY